MSTFVGHVGLQLSGDASGGGPRAEAFGTVEWRVSANHMTGPSLLTLVLCEPSFLPIQYLLHTISTSASCGHRSH